MPARPHAELVHLRNRRPGRAVLEPRVIDVRGPERWAVYFPVTLRRVRI